MQFIIRCFLLYFYTFNMPNECKILKATCPLCAVEMSTVFLIRSINVYRFPFYIKHSSFLKCHSIVFPAFFCSTTFLLVQVASSVIGLSIGIVKYRYYINLQYSFRIIRRNFIVSSYLARRWRA